MGLQQLPEWLWHARKVNKTFRVRPHRSRTAAIKNRADLRSYLHALEPDASQHFDRPQVGNLVQNPQGSIPKKPAKKGWIGEGSAIARGRRRVVKDRQETYILSLSNELLGHLEGHTSPNEYPPRVAVHRSW